MLEKTRDLLKSPPADTFTANVIIECFLVHARNLIHFLQPKKEQESDVLAEDFFVGGREAWERVFANVPQFDDVRTRANKELAHLTYDRLQSPSSGKPWGVAKLGEAILDGIDLFRKSIDQGLLHADWRTAGENSPRQPLSETIVPNHTKFVTDVATKWPFP